MENNGENSTFQKSQTGLILAIIFASSVIAGSLVFFGLQFAPKADLASEDKMVSYVEKAFNNYVEKQKTKQQQDYDKAQQNDDAQRQAMAGNLIKYSKTEDHVRGNPDAPVTIIEYSDYICPFCHRVHPTLQAFVEKNKDKVNWVYRHYPLSGHDPMATQAAIAAECAAELGGNDGFWAYSDKLFTTELSALGGYQLEDWVAVATTLKLPTDKFRACLSSQKYLAKVTQQLNDGDKAGVSGTPGNFVINNATGKTVLVDGARDATYFQNALDEVMKAS